MQNESLATLFREMLNAHQGALWKVARAYTTTPEDGQDLAQEILLQVWRSLPQFQGLSQASTWFYRVALNTAITWNRKEQRLRDREQPLIIWEDLSARGLETAEQVVQRETLNRLYAAIQQLSKTDSVLVFLYLEDLNYRQIAEVLGISEGHVGVKLNRAKKALADLMREQNHESR